MKVNQVETFFEETMSALQTSVNEFLMDLPEEDFISIQYTRNQDADFDPACCAIVVYRKSLTREETEERDGGREEEVIPE